MKLNVRLKEYKIAVCYYLFRVFPIKRNKIVLCNYVGNGFGCNPKYIAIELHKRQPNCDMVWITKNMKDEFPNYIRKVRWDSIQSVFELATSGIWIDNQRKLWYHKKRKKQFFVETWHGGAGPIKKIGADNPANSNNKPYECTSRHMDKIVDVMVSNGVMRSEIYRRAFLYTGRILECGAPRNDILVNGWHQYVPLIHDYYSIPKNAKIVLYAPTYRKGRKTDKMQIDGMGIIRALENKFSAPFYMLKRLHPTMVNKANELKYDQCIINASEYDDMQELLAAADVLISDYSSVISEFSIMNKPIFLLAEDVNDYGDERDFYIDYFNLPYTVATSEEALITNIGMFDEKKYIKKLGEYKETIGSKETGIAAKAVVDEILKHI